MYVCIYIYMYALSLSIYIYIHIHTPPQNKPTNPTLMIKAPLVRPFWPRASRPRGFGYDKTQRKICGGKNGCLWPRLGFRFGLGFKRLGCFGGHSGFTGFKSVSSGGFKGLGWGVLNAAVAGGLFAVLREVQVPSAV